MEARRWAIDSPVVFALRAQRGGVCLTADVACDQEEANQMAWTDERVETLKKLWAEGLSASQIANRLGDVTRNAVIGKVHRLGLSGRATTSRMKTVRPRKKMARPQQQRSIRFGGLGGSVREALQFAASQRGANQSFEPTEELAIPVEQRATIATLKECSCRWPVGDPTHEDFYFCGGDKVAGLPYCEFHARKAYQPAQQRRRDRHVQKQTATG